MIWPFRRKINSESLEIVAADAALAVMNQMARLSQKNAVAIGRLQNLNGLISGYGLGIGSCELKERNLIFDGTEKPLADTLQKVFERFDQDIHIWKHVEHQSYAFVTGVKAGGQETINKHRNASLWVERGSRYDLLYQFLLIITRPYVIARGTHVRTLLDEFGVRMDENLIEKAVNQLLGNND
jgi:hypothetical protein